MDDEGGTVAGKISAQLLKDIVARVADKNDKRIWIFADESMEALKPEFAKKIIEVIIKDKAMQQHIANNLGVREFDEFYRVYLEEGKLQDVINSLMVEF